MELPRREGLLQRWLRTAAEGRGFPLVCMALAAAGTVSASYPVTAVVVPAALLLPARWKQITLVTAIGSAIGATVFVIVLHHLGWAQLYERFPELASHQSWRRVIAWVSAYGGPALFLVAASPLPQTPALIFFAIARHDYAIIFIAMLAGKLLKYALFAWAAAHFPERFSNGLTSLFRRGGAGGEERG